MKLGRNSGSIACTALALVCAFSCTILGGCRGAASKREAAASSAATSSQGAAPKTALLGVRLEEHFRDDVYAHAEDREHEGALAKADVSSTLVLKFEDRRPAAALEADPRWKLLQRGVEAISAHAEAYRSLAERAATASDDAGQVAALQADVRAARVAQKTFYEQLISAELLTPEEFTSAVLRVGGGFDEATQQDIEGEDPLAVFGELFQSKLHALEEQARALAAEEHVVTVRAVLDPLVGPPQLLQVPNYYEKSDDDLEDDRRRARTVEFERLKAEFEAAQKLSTAINEVLEKRGSFADAAKTAWNKLRADVRELGDWLEARARVLEQRAKSALEAKPADSGALSAEELQFWKDLAAFAEDLKSLRSIVKRVAELGDHLNFEFIEGLHDDVVALKDRVTGDGEDAWGKRLARMRGNLGALVDAAAGDVKARLEALRDAFAADLDELRDGLKERLPLTAEALQAIDTLGVFDRTAEIVEDGVTVPQPLEDLPKARLDLRKNPVNDGDSLAMEVKVWRRSDFESEDARRAPLESYSFTSDLIRSGWRWSGDIIFTRAFDGPSSDSFTANAAVSREYHWYSRTRTDSWFNRLDPGIGFHAAQLNMDPDSTTEIGVGLNLSLWSGLLRFGAGSNISIDDDREYWYFGFGLIDALDQLSKLRRLDDKD